MTARPSTLRRTIDARLGLTKAGTPREDAWIVRLPSVVIALLAVMVTIFVIEWAMPRGTEYRFERLFGFVPARLLMVLGERGGTSLMGGAGPLISHMFLHGNLPHLLLNGFGLAIFGTAVARRLEAESHRAGRRLGDLWNVGLFGAFFLLSGVAGALAFAVVNTGIAGATNLIGASGAISGLMAASMRFALRAFAPYGPAAGDLAPVTSKPVMITTAVYIGFNLVTALGVGGMMSGGLDIAWEAHVGGYLFGLFAFPLFDQAARRQAPIGWYGD